MSTARAVLLAAGFACAALGRPAAAGESRLITFPEAITIALEQNSTLLRARNETALNRAAVAQANLNFLPDLRLSACHAPL